MKLSVSTDGTVATIYLAVPVTGTDRMLDDDTVVTMDVDRITAVEVLNARTWGDPFDEAAAERVLAWVREQLATRATS